MTQKGEMTGEIWERFGRDWKHLSHVRTPVNKGLLAIMGEMEEKKLTYNDIPTGYPLCFNNNCQLRDKCMHYQACLLRPDGRTSGPAIYPDAWKDGECQMIKCYPNK